MVATINRNWSYSTERMPVEAWNVVRVSVFLRDDYTCRYCGKKTTELHCDHIIPLSKGGTNHPYNLQTLCGECNMRKGTNYSGFRIKSQAWRMWDILIKHEPQLVDLYQAARSSRDIPTEPSYCANYVFFGWDGLKGKLVQLVGNSHRGDPVLGTSEAYDVAYEVIYNALPCCRNCWCG